MKITKQVIRNFEQDQKRFGTKVGLYNVVWQVAADIFKNLGIHHIKTSEKRKGR